jgi:hypothetical protein
VLYDEAKYCGQQRLIMGVNGSKCLLRSHGAGLEINIVALLSCPSHRRVDREPGIPQNDRLNNAKIARLCTGSRDLVQTLICIRKYCIPQAARSSIAICNRTENASDISDVYL